MKFYIKDKKGNRYEVDDNTNSRRFTDADEDFDENIDEDIDEDIDIDDAENILSDDEISQIRELLTRAPELLALLDNKVTDADEDEDDDVDVDIDVHTDEDDDDDVDVDDSYEEEEEEIIDTKSRDSKRSYGSKLKKSKRMDDSLEEDKVSDSWQERYNKISKGGN